MQHSFGFFFGNDSFVQSELYILFQLLLQVDIVVAGQERSIHDLELFLEIVAGSMVQIHLQKRIQSFQHALFRGA